MSVWAWRRLGASEEWLGSNKAAAHRSRLLTLSTRDLKAAFTHLGAPRALRHGLKRPWNHVATRFRIPFFFQDGYRIGFGSTVFLALVLTHWSCAEETAPSLHLVAERVDISTGGALVVDIDGGGAANFIFSHSSSAARAAVVFGCRRRGSDGDSMCDLAHGGDIRVWEASSGWQPRLRSESAVSLEAEMAASASCRPKAAPCHPRHNPVERQPWPFPVVSDSLAGAFVRRAHTTRAALCPLWPQWAAVWPLVPRFSRTLPLERRPTLGLDGVRPIFLTQLDSHNEPSNQCHTHSCGLGALPTQYK